MQDVPIQATTISSNHQVNHTGIHLIAAEINLIHDALDYDHDERIKPDG